MSATVPNLFTIEEAQQHLRLSPRGFQDLRNRGDGPPETRIGGRILFREDQLLGWLDKRTQPPMPDDREKSEDEPMIPNEATRLYRARVAARKERTDKERRAKGAVASLREQQRQAGSSGAELQVLGTPDPEIARALRIERAAQG